MTKQITITIRDRVYNEIFYPKWQEKAPSKSERVEELIELGLRSKRQQELNKEEE